MCSDPLSTPWCGCSRSVAQKIALPIGSRLVSIDSGGDSGEVLSSMELMSFRCLGPLDALSLRVEEVGRLTHGTRRH
eukprot:2903229-Amphidinium_carterae.1